MVGTFAIIFSSKTLGFRAIVVLLPLEKSARGYDILEKGEKLLSPTN